MDAIILIENSLRHFVPEVKLTSFESKLFLNHSKMKNLREYISLNIIEGIILMGVVMILLSQFFSILKKPELVLLGGTLGFFAPFAINYLYQDLIFERRKKQKEELLSDLLLQASIFCDQTSAQNTISKLAEQDFPLLSEDFRRANNEIKNGASAQEALERIKLLNQSKIYSRVIDLFIQGYQSGAGLSELLKETAEDLLETKAIVKERQAVMLVTKYTLLLAAGLIVPAIMGLIVGLVSGLNFNSMEELSFGLSGEQRKELFQTAMNGTTIYIFEYACISSFFLALQEGNKKNFWIYLCIIAPLAGVVFFISKGVS